MNLRLIFIGALIVLAGLVLWGARSITAAVRAQRATLDAVSADS